MDRLSSRGGAAALFLALATVAPGTGVAQPAPPTSPSGESSWTREDIAFLATFSINSLAPLAKDASNRVSQSPAAVQFGKSLFFDSRLSSNGLVACATCHRPELYFTDGLTTAEGVGPTVRNTPSIMGAVYNTWFFWDGRTDSAWAQALGPLEDPNEHGATRTLYAKLISKLYKPEYEALFGTLADLSVSDRFPDRAGPHSDADGTALWTSMTAEDRATVTEIFVNIGKSIAAFEETLMPAPARFDAYVDAVVSGDAKAQNEIFSAEEVAGLRLFLGKANCSQCHNGPLFTNQAFHSIGIPPFDPKRVELGRTESITIALQAEFNCRSEHSDTDRCRELEFVKRTGFELIGAFKTPSLRNVAETAPYMHRGLFESLPEVLEHYNTAPIPLYDPDQHSERPHTDIVPLKLTEDELSQLEAFLHTLTGERPIADYKH